MIIERTVWDGLDAVLLQTETVRLVAVTAVGPRIAWFSKPEGENLLYWDRDAVRRGEWRLYGGHRVWLTRPLADESEDAYMPDNDPCAVTLLADGMDACAPASPTRRVARGLRVRALPDGSVSVVTYARNDGDMLFSCGLWAPTCVPATRPIEIPLGCGDATATWDVVHLAIPRVFAGNVTRLDDECVVIRDNTMILIPAGRCVKRCVRGEQGIVRLRCEGFAFQKETRFQPDARYPLRGCNLAAFIGEGNCMAELETYGGERAVKPGETLAHEEIWRLADDA